MDRYSPAEGIFCLRIPAGENAPALPAAFGAEDAPFLTLESCIFTDRDVFAAEGEAAGQVIETANGEVVAGGSGRKRKVRSCRRAVLTFSCREGQVLTGLGQHERGILDYARETERLYEHNMKIAVPFVLGSDGWGIIIEAGCAMVYTGLGNGFRLELAAVDDLRLTVLEGRDCGEVLRKLSRLSGLPAMLPKWAFGYIQSKERYRSAEELVSVAAEFRRQGLGLDCIVLDWMSWKDGCWGDKTPDPERFPDVRALTEALHSMGVRLMVSVWPNMVRGDDCDAFRNRGLFLPGTQTYDAFNPEARDLYWEQADRGWMAGGTDALWCDSCEPVTDPDWCGGEKRSEEERMRLITEDAELRMDPAGMNAYGSEHTRGLAEHWQREYPGKRPVLLARSGDPGSASHGTILWSGDICAKWEVLRAQVTEAVRSALSGLHYWTLDIGGFFTGKKEQWFWDGDYPEGTADPGYRELYTRWFQFGAFLPVFRSHGTDTPREPWCFGEQYGILREIIRLRYRLLPYLYSTAAQACRTGMPMLRAMMAAFPGDPEVLSCGDSYMLGDALLVKPVCRPLEDGGDRTAVRLPAGADWYHWYTGEFRRGGQETTEETPLDRFPLYVQAGSILPLAEGARCAAEVQRPAAELMVFTGADGAFALYDDAGDGDGWRRDETLRIPLQYDERTRTLNIGQKEGGLPADADLRIRFRLPDGGEVLRNVRYTGAAVTVSCG